MVFLTFWSSDHIFFWDTISQGSRLVDFYYQNNFQSLYLPTEIDQGHPPLFQLYIALGWKLFGRSLTVSHFMMLPILIGIVWQLYFLIRKFFKPKYHLIALTLPFFDTTFLAQSILVSPDILLLFAFLLGLNGVKSEKKWMIILGTIFLGLTSIRGIVMVIILYIIAVIPYLQIASFQSLTSNIIKKAFPFIPSFVLVSTYLIFHFIETGWWISTPSESWNTQRGMVGVSGILKNIGIAAWRLIDFGKFGIWTILVIWGFRQLKNRSSSYLDKKEKELIIILFTFIIVNVGLFMWWSNPLAHRYFLPAFVIQALLVGYILLDNKIFGKASKYVLATVLLLMISGNFWVYPDKIAQGWDSTMAHVPYYDLREEMLVYMEEKNIPVEEVKSWFPNKSHLDELDLSNRGFGMNNSSENPKYYYYSNVMNDVPDSFFEKTEKSLTQKKYLEKRGVTVILFSLSN